MGIDSPLQAHEYVGRLTCTLSRIRVLQDGAGFSSTPGLDTRHFPELYQGDAVEVNRAFHRMPANLRPIFDAHYVVRSLPVTVKADFLAVSLPCYFTRLNQARRFVEGFLSNARS